MARPSEEAQWFSSSHPTHYSFVLPLLLSLHKTTINSVSTTLPLSIASLANRNYQPSQSRQGQGHGRRGIKNSPTLKYSQSPRVDCLLCFLAHVSGVLPCLAGWSDSSEQSSWGNLVVDLGGRAVESVFEFDGGGG